MKKNLLSITILVLLAVIIVINIWKPDLTTKKAKELSTPMADSLSKEKDIPGAKLTSLDQGAMAPDFELTTLDGKKAKLSDYRGQTVILNFWATWCPPCKAEMPHMENFYKKTKEKNITIVSVNLTNMEKGMDAVQSFAKDYGLSFNILLDENGSAGKTYQAFTIPTSYIIDKEGKIANKVIGPMDEEMMQQLTKDN